MKADLVCLCAAYLQKMRHRTSAGLQDLCNSTERLPAALPEGHWVGSQRKKGCSLTSVKAVASLEMRKRQTLFLCSGRWSKYSLVKFQCGAGIAAKIDVGGSAYGHDFLHGRFGVSNVIERSARWRDENSSSKEVV